MADDLQKAYAAYQQALYQIQNPKVFWRLMDRIVFCGMELECSTSAMELMIMLKRLS